MQKEDCNLLKTERKNLISRIVDESDFLPLKLFNDVLNKMIEKDNVSRKIVDNLEAFNSCNIKLINSNNMLNSVLTSDDKKNSILKISLGAQEMCVAHEVGHFLLDLFSNNELPSDYMEINYNVQKSLCDRYFEVSSEISKYSDYLYNKLISNIEQPMNFIGRNPDVFNDLKKKNNDITENEYISSIIADYYIYLINFDLEGFGYSIISNILDSSFHGENPFRKFYGKDDFDPLLVAREEEYFLEDKNGKYFAGFEEQFADFFVLKLYRDRLYLTINKLEKLIGKEWFFMMDEYFLMISNRVEEKAKSYRKL